MNSSTIDITALETEALLLNEYRIDIEYSFTYPHCDTCELPLRFEIWFAETEAPEDTSELSERVRVIGVLTRSDSIEDVDVQTTEDFFVLYFQVWCKETVEVSTEYIACYKVLAKRTERDTVC